MLDLLFLQKTKYYALDFLHLRFVDVLDILLLTLLLYYIYKLVKGTVAVHIFIGIVIFYLFWQLTRILQIEMVSNVLGEFVKVGVVVLVVVFQQEIRKFLLMIGSTKFASKSHFLKQWRFAKAEGEEVITDITSLVMACKNMGDTRTGALIVIKRQIDLDFVKSSGDKMNIKVNAPIIQSIFYKNSTLHDGAVIIEDNIITATRVILPVSNSRKIPLRFGLRHRAAVGITEKTDALALVVSEETGQTSYIKDGAFEIFEDHTDLIQKLKADLS